MSPDPHYTDGRVTLHHGNCLDVLRSLPADSVDAVVTDPPYGLGNTNPGHVADALSRWLGGKRDYLPEGTGLHGNKWDAFVPPPAVWDECYRVLKPGGHLLAFAGSRTVDLMTLSVRLAGFDVRDSLAWIYGDKFPKGLDVSKAIDQGAGDNRARQLEFTAWMRSTGVTAAQIDAATGSHMGGHYLTAAEQPAIATADRFDMIRHLLPDVPEHIERLVAECTGIEWSDYVKRGSTGTHAKSSAVAMWRAGYGIGAGPAAEAGRELHDVAASDESAAWQGWNTQLKPAIEPIIMARKAPAGTIAANVLTYGTGALNIAATGVEGRWPANVLLDEVAAADLDTRTREPDGTGASRFYYTGRAAAAERPVVDGVAHPTVKPLDLMRWLVRLVTPPGGTVLEPFAGSGTTVEACIAEGFGCIAAEREAAYLPLTMARIYRRRDAVAAIAQTGDDLGLFGVDQ